MSNISKMLLILIIVCFFIIPVLAEDIEWVDPQEKTLRLMEFVIRDGYYIEASDFYDNSSIISVYDPAHNLISRNISRINDWMEVNDRFNITIIDLKEKTGNIGATHGLNVLVDQWVRIESRVAGRPVPRVSIAPHKERVKDKMVVRRIFPSGYEISLNFSVGNYGKAVLKDTILKINSTLPLLLDDKLDYELLDIKAGNVSDNHTVRFRAPYVEEKKHFTIWGMATGIDRWGKTYTATGSLDIEVIPQIDKRISIRKYVTEKVYMGDAGVVSIIIINNRTQKIENLTLTDTLPGGLIPVKTNLSWNFSLEPLEQKSISYLVKPTKPGTYYFPPGNSRIEYKDGLEFDKKLNKMIVNGPYVVLSKIANIENPIRGDNVTITIEAKNLGTSVAIVKIADDVPVNYSLKPGNMSFSNILKTVVLRTGNSTSFSYTLTINDTGSFILPPVKATVLDQFLYQDERYTQKISSNNLSINVKEPVIIAQQEPVKISRTPAPTIIPEQTGVPVPTGTTVPATKSTPGFHGYVFIMVYIVLHVIRNKDEKRKL
jgi:uncharacterized repeat protein (TIGR01451 family)